MSYTNESGRRQIIEEGAAAVDLLGRAVAALTEVYEHLDEYAADRLEDEVFKPLQSGYGLLRRTLTGFASRHGIEEPRFESAHTGLPEDVRTALHHVADAAADADAQIADLQDTLLPVEVGDPELRAGLAGARTVIAPVPDRCVDLIRMFGR